MTFNKKPSLIDGRLSWQWPQNGTTSAAMIRAKARAGTPKRLEPRIMDRNQDKNMAKLIVLCCCAGKTEKCLRYFEVVHTTVQEALQGLNSCVLMA